MRVMDYGAGSGVLGMYLCINLCRHTYIYMNAGLSGKMLRVPIARSRGVNVPGAPRRGEAPKRGGDSQRVGVLQCACGCCRGPGFPDAADRTWCVVQRWLKSSSGLEAIASQGVASLASHMGARSGTELLLRSAATGEAAPCVSRRMHAPRPATQTLSHTRQFVLLLNS